MLSTLHCCAHLLHLLELLATHEAANAVAHLGAVAPLLVLRAKIAHNSEPKHYPSTSGMPGQRPLRQGIRCVWSIRLQRASIRLGRSATLHADAGT